MRKKIGIITIHFPYNYGAMLQAYATQKAIADLGGECEIIDYRPYMLDSVYHFRGEDALHAPKRFIKNIGRVLLGRTKKYARFEEFLKKDIVCSERKYSRINKSLQMYDALLVGSDQVWNPGITHDMGEYYLEFAADHQKRYSFSSSFGVAEVDAEYVKRHEGAITRFAQLACRENEGVRIIQDEFGVPCKKTCDPVFLLEKEKWEKISEVVPEIEGRYILLYALEENEQLYKAAQKLKEQYGIAIVSIHPLGQKVSFADYNIDYIGPKEFVWLIAHADYVCTNSFHGTAFSIIMGSRFVSCLHTKTGSRVKNLLEEFGPAELGKVGQSVIYQMDKASYERMGRFISESKRYLEDIVKTYE